MAAKNKYNIANLLASAAGYKGVPFPNAFIDGKADGELKDVNEHYVKGTILRKKDHRGIWYFMPVSIKHPVIGKDGDVDKGSDKYGILELRNAIINITGSKTIVETPLVGRKGTIKELISIEDYKISITAFVQSADGSYPEEEITALKDLYNINESVELICALTDLVLDESDRVVITSISFPSTPGVEDGQAVKIECKTDKEFELIM